LPRDDRPGLRLCALAAASTSGPFALGVAGPGRRSGYAAACRRAREARRGRPV